MFEREAAWIGQRLAALPNDQLSPVMNIGSRTEKPWVDQWIFAPLKARGVAVVDVDIDEGSDAHIIADILTDEGFARLRAVQPRMVLLCNVLEHVTQPELMTRRCLDILAPGGRLLITVPRAYPHHRAPIDTMLRPTPQEVLAFAPDAVLVEGEMLPMGSYWDVLRKRPWVILRQILRAPFPFLGWERYKRTMSKLWFLYRPYEVTFAVLRRRSEA